MADRRQFTEISSNVSCEVDVIRQRASEQLRRLLEYNIETNSYAIMTETVHLSELEEAEEVAMIQQLKEEEHDDEETDDSTDEFDFTQKSGNDDNDCPDSSVSVCNEIGMNSTSLISFPSQDPMYETCSSQVAAAQTVDRQKKAGPDGSNSLQFDVSTSRYASQQDDKLIASQKDHGFSSIKEEIDDNGLTPSLSHKSKSELFLTGSTCDGQLNNHKHSSQHHISHQYQRQNGYNHLLYQNHHRKLQDHWQSQLYQDPPIAYRTKEEEMSDLLSYSHSVNKTSHRSANMQLGFIKRESHDGKHDVELEEDAKDTSKRSSVSQSMTGNICSDEVSLELGISKGTPCHHVTALDISNRLLSTIQCDISVFNFLHFVNVSNNSLTYLPDEICSLPCLNELDISNNRLEYLPKQFGLLKSLVRLDLRSNELTSLPDSMVSCSSLQTLYLSGNRLSQFPDVVIQLQDLRRLYIGSNNLRRIPQSISMLSKLEVLYLGGNLLRFLPNSICLLRSLQVLYLGDNRLEELPTNLSNLTQLSTLNLHKNQLPALPPDIVDMPSLRQLSLRGNPLVTNFALDATTHSPLSLQELCARTIKNLNIPYCNKCVPQVLCNYLDSAKCCSNPKCRGVYFTQGIKNIEFVDFCGKYRVPLLRYLCSPCFVEPKVPHVASQQVGRKIRRVLLDNYEDPCEHAVDAAISHLHD